jgi:hypothetical protein
MVRVTAKKLRSQRGQGIVEAALGAVLLTITTVAAVLLMVNAGVSAYYKLKLQAVTLSTAQYAAGIRSGDPELASKTTQFANYLLRRSGLPSAASVTAAPSEQTVVVSIAVNNLKAVGNLPIFNNISLSDTEVSSPTVPAVGYMYLDYEMANSSPPTPQPANPAYLPILSSAQIDPNKNVYMLDTYNWPTTHVIYHGVYPGFPKYRGVGTSAQEQQQTLLTGIKYALNKLQANTDPEVLKQFPYPCIAQPEPQRPVGMK